MIKLYINSGHKLWTCPGCGDVFEVPNTRHSCPERRHFKDRRKAMIKGAGVGFAGGFVVFLFVLVLIQRNLISTYTDVVSFMQSEMANIHLVNKVILDAQPVTWGGQPEPPRRWTR